MSTKRQVFRWIPMAVWIGVGGSLAVPVHVHASESVEKPVSQDAKKAFSLIKRMQSAYKKVSDYTAILIKQERVNGQLLPEETMELKFRKPYSVYLKWIKEPKKGQETIFVRGQNDNKLVAHPPSLSMTVQLKPKSRLAMKGNRHPITEIDFGHTIQMIAKDFHRSQSQPQDDVKIVDLGVSDVEGTPSDCFQVTFPKDQTLGYYAYRSKICVGKTTHLPTMLVIWDHNEQVIEKYIYRQVKTNVGLRNEDFDPKNPQYNYK